MRIGKMNYSPLWAKVRRVGRAGDAAQCVAVAEEVVTFFDEHGWPDNWPSWRNALADGLEVFTPERNTVEDLFG